MNQKKPRRSKFSYACVNHPQNNDTKECERCHKFYCSECYIEDWHETFFQQFLGQKRKIIKTIYCFPCQKRVHRVRMIAYIGLLILFSTPFIIWILMGILG